MRRKRRPPKAKPAKAANAERRAASTKRPKEHSQRVNRSARQSRKARRRSPRRILTKSRPRTDQSVAGTTVVGERVAIAFRQRGEATHSVGRRWDRHAWRGGPEYSRP